MGIAQDNGAMEGKEVRLGSAATALWSIVTTVTSNGSVNGMHDSTMPLSGMMEMLNMQINTWFGGVGVGFMNYYTFIIIAVFISGLMVGRTPEFLGKKVEAREMKIATIVALLHPLIILGGVALSCFLFAHYPEFVAGEGGWLNNPSFHGLSEQLYEYTSAAANNGSGFEGFGRQYLLLELHYRLDVDFGTFPAYRRSGSHCWSVGRKEICSGECRYAEDGYSNFRCDDFCRYLYCGCLVILPGTCIEYDC